MSSNGVLSFRQPFSKYATVPFPFATEILIAPFWIDVDIQLAGQVSYRFSTDQSLLDAAQVLINESLNVYFSPAFLFIATWDKVPQLREDLSVVCMYNEIIVPIFKGKPASEEYYYTNPNI